MANDYWSADTAEHTCSAEADHWRDTDRTDGSAAGWYDGWVFRTNVTAGFGIVTEDFGPS